MQIVLMKNDLQKLYNASELVLDIINAWDAKGWTSLILNRADLHT